ncbi:MAG: fibronectin type III domain-containing protein [Thermodesulfobacteriota bacterium]
MKRSNWIKNIIGAIILPVMLIAFTGCGGGGATGVSGTGGTGGGAASLSATINWSPVTTNIDGSPLTELAGYRVHYGTEPGVYTTTVDIADPTAASAVISGLQAGTTYYFVVTAYDTSGNQSAYSNEGVKTL